jgi:putative DNA methylase
VASPNPAAKGAHVPLVRSFWLSTKAGKKTWVEPVVDQSTMTYRFEVRTGNGEPRAGTVNRNGGVCLLTGSPMPLEYVRTEGKAGRLGVRLMSIVADAPRGRTYLPPNEEHERVATNAEPRDVPETDLPEQALGFRVQNYGMTKHRQLFTARQLLALTVFSDLVGEARARIGEDSEKAGLSEGHAKSYADGVATYLGLSSSRNADYWSTLTTWEPSGELVGHVFTKQTLSMVWDYPEANPVGDASGNWLGAVGWTCKVCERLGAFGHLEGEVQQRDAQSIAPVDGGFVFSTDPPYYDNVPYADLADCFYVWLRRSLQQIYPSLLGTVLVPKAEELVAECSASRFPGRELS